MRNVRPVWSPAVSSLSHFHEINVRTYVHANGEPGVWFYSLDAANPALASGRMLVSVDVGPRGQIMDSGIVASGTTIAAPDLEACVVALVPGMHYEPLGEQHTARIHYQFLFSSG